ncbi:MAG: sterol desaturase family protein [Salaquimonas sp.]|nr:sterol desaturase family protein [Salaquimonas sp.]
MRLSIIAYFADFYFAGFAILVLVAAGIVPAIAAGHSTAIAVWVAAAAAGVMAWSLAEYWVHRYFYHEVPGLRELHGHHHAEPEAFIGGPPVLAILIIFALAYLPLVFVSSIVAGGFTTGALTGYMAYMLVHHAVHYWKPAPGTLLFTLRRHHALHHHHSEEGNFGIITSFWDRVFGTEILPAGKPKKRHAPT